MHEEDHQQGVPHRTCIKWLEDQLIQSDPFTTTTSIRKGTSVPWYKEYVHIARKFVSTKDPGKQQ